MVFARQGSTGQVVMNVQTMLNFALTTQPPLGVDGIFGAKTLARVIEFQKKIKVTQDGVVGPITGQGLAVAVSERLAKIRAA